MWVPFGLPGQVVLGQTRVFNASGGSEWQSGSEAFATGSGGTWTRPPIALNQWRGYDPLVALFDRLDDEDFENRTDPEGYVYARANPIGAFDPTGKSSGVKLSFDTTCDHLDRLAILNATMIAYLAILTCTSDMCQLRPLKRAWLNALVSVDATYCPRRRSFIELDYAVDLSGLLQPTSGPGTGFRDVLAYTDTVKNETEYAPAALESFYKHQKPQCLAVTIAHERGHRMLHKTLSYLEDNEELIEREVKRCISCDRPTTLTPKSGESFQ